MKTTNAIKKVREDLQLSQIEFADLLGVQRPQLAKIEGSYRKLPVDCIAPLAQLTALTQDKKKGRAITLKPAKTHHRDTSLNALQKELDALPHKIDVETVNLQRLMEKHRNAKKVLENIGDQGFENIKGLNSAQKSILKTAFARLKSLAEGDDYKAIIHLRIRIAAMKASLIEARKIEEEWSKEY